MNNIDITFLDVKQITGSNALSIFSKIGTQSVITDFAILQGGWFNSEITLNNSKKLTERTGCWWTKDKDSGKIDLFAILIDERGRLCFTDVSKCGVGSRPCLKYSSIKEFATNKRRSEDGVLRVDFGIWPQIVPNNDILEELKKLDEKGKTNNVNLKFPIYLEDGNCECNIEWLDDVIEYNGKTYVNVVARSYKWSDTLSNGINYKNGNLVRIEILPITYIVDEESDIAIPEKIILAGVKFNNAHYNGDFDHTIYKKYLQDYFLPAITQSLDYNKANNQSKENIDSIITNLLNLGYSKDEIIEKIINYPEDKQKETNNFQKNIGSK